MVEIAHFPKAPVVAVAECECGAGFEDTNELREIR
jgi:hypothetical protein